ncbi:MAG: electron transfer flavoprotein subunit alpha/FixB family protein [Dehalococcoidales bacterium]|nr:electron transfer flavoprotein subunit alpha/FixB family protein [Dehalococcoidales bacterium]
MKQILVLIEHRNGVILDISFEMLQKAASVAAARDNELVAVLLGHNVSNLAAGLTGKANRILVADNPQLGNYNYETYSDVLANLIKEQKPELVSIGHTTTGMDLAPGLATHLNLPLITSCIDFHLQDNKLTGIRQMYDGKINTEVTSAGHATYMITLRPGSFPIQESAAFEGKIEAITAPVKEPANIKFIESIEAVLTGVDITKADILVSVGQGIGDLKNIPLVEELATLMNATLSCSRPVVDKKWLPKERQVGSSGKTVKPKVYLAIGISGSFQHLMGLKGGTIIAINKDPKAPIFRVADYGIVGDLFQVVPVLKEKVKAIKGS